MNASLARLGSKCVIAAALLLGLTVGRPCLGALLFVSTQNQVLTFDTTLYYGSQVSAPPSLAIGAGSPLQQATGLAFDASGTLYVGSYQTNQILKFNSVTGSYLGVFATTTGGGPLGIEFGPNGDLYAVVNPNNGGGRVQQFGGTTGALVQTLPGTLANPQDLAFDATGRLLVTTFNDSGVKVFQSGAFQSFTSSFQPTGLTFGPDGNLYVADNGYNAVRVYSPTGTPLFTTQSSVASGPGLAFESNNSLLAADRGGSAVTRINLSTHNQFGSYPTSAFVGAFVNGLSRTGYLALQPTAAAAVPEPASLALWGIGALAFGIFHRRRQRAA